MHEFARSLFVLQLAATMLMTGLIWFVQIVHYPLFAAVGSSAFVPYARRHATLTGYVVGPPMLVELGSSLLALWPPLRPFFLTLPEAIASALLVCGVWATTGLIHVPLHTRLGLAREPSLLRRLVATNWIRTVLWSLRAALLLTWTWRALSAR